VELDALHGGCEGMEGLIEMRWGEGEGEAEEDEESAEGV
jgi:hypothetical protein